MGPVSETRHKSGSASFGSGLPLLHERLAAPRPVSARGIVPPPRGQLRAAVDRWRACLPADVEPVAIPAVRAPAVSLIRINITL